MAWKKPSEELSKFLEETVASFNVKKKTMFGCPVFFAHDNMVTGVFENDIFIRLSEKDRKKIISEYDEVIPFEPLKGRIMKEYVVIPDHLYNDPEKFQELLNLSYDYVLTLPSKKIKPKKKN
jgi:TfoX/Sxy family transcriptional regulator of competence genes